VLDPIGPQTVTEGDTLQVLVTASDPDGTISQLIAEQLPANALFVDSLNNVGLLTFTPDYTQAGTDTVLFIATDGALSDSEYVEITVIEAGNQIPVLSPIGPQAVDEGGLLQLVISAADPDSTVPTLIAENLPANAVFNDQSGLHTVRFIASDGVASDTENVDITVNNVNLAPVLDTIFTPQTVNEGDSLLITVTAADPDSVIPALSAEGLPPNATFLDNGDGSGDFRFDPDYFQAGPYQVLFIASDGVLADSQFVDIDVLEINQVPILDTIPSPQSVAEADSLLFTVTANDPDLVIPALTAEGLPLNATFLDNGDGSGDFRFDPDYFQAGTYPVLFVERQPGAGPRFHSHPADGGGGRFATIYSHRQRHRSDHTVISGGRITRQRHVPG
jgi:hypothetical protein